MIRTAPKHWYLETDVVAIGTGGGGLAAAITAYDHVKWYSCRSTLSRGGLGQQACRRVLRGGQLHGADGQRRVDEKRDNQRPGYYHGYLAGRYAAGKSSDLLQSAIARLEQ